MAIPRADGGARGIIVGAARATSRARPPFSCSVVRRGCDDLTGEGTRSRDSEDSVRGYNVPCSALRTGRVVRLPESGGRKTVAPDGVFAIRVTDAGMRTPQQRGPD